MMGTICRFGSRTICRPPTRYDLGSWGLEAYCDLLSGGYLQQKKLVLYPFLKLLSRFHLEADDLRGIFPSEEGDIQRIRRILRGKEDFSFQVTLSVPHRFHTWADGEKIEVFRGAQRALAGQTDRPGRDVDLRGYVKQILQMPVSDTTVLDIIQAQIMRFCTALFEADGVRRKPPLGLYANGTAAQAGLMKWNSMMECYTGGRPFLALAAFKNGTSDLELFL